MTDPRPPLWEVMHKAHIAAPNQFGYEYAAEIRALCDWLLPDEPEPHRGMRPGGTNLTYQETLSVERQRLRSILLAEAERAEGGQG